MSISKPTLTDIWAEATPANIVDPGALNGTGWTAASAAPPFRWMNWILNKIEKSVRYLLARGIPDYDAGETYRAGDRVQYTVGGNLYTFVCIQANSPSTPKDPTYGSYWAIWALTNAQLTARLQRGIADYAAAASYIVGDRVQYVNGGTTRTYVCVQGNNPNTPKDPTYNAYWNQWGYDSSQLRTEIDQVVSVHANQATVVATNGTLSHINQLVFTGIVNVVKQLTFTLEVTTDGYGQALATVNLSGDAAFTTTCLQAFANNKSANVYEITGHTHIDISGTNQVQIGLSGYAHETIYQVCVMLVGD